MAQDQTAEEQQVRALDDEERLAALKRDVSALERLWSDQLMLNAPNNHVVVGKRAECRSCGRPTDKAPLHEHLEK